MKRLVKFTFIIPLVLLFASCGEDREALKVENVDLVEAVYSSVTVQPEDVYTVKSTVSGYLDDILHDEGTGIAKGDLLFVVRDITGNSTEQNARLSYELAQKNFLGDRSVLNDIQLEISNQALKRKNDSLNYSRNQKLYDAGGITAVELEQSQLMFESSKASHIAAVNKYNRTSRELKTAMEQARNNFTSSASRSSDAHIVAALNGKVYSVLKERGDLVNIQEPIAIVGSADQFEINLMVDEVDIIRVKEGQKIIVDLEAYPNSVFEAKVDRIVPKMDDQTQTFKVIGKFTSAPKQLYMGLTGEASIVVEERKNVVAIPRDYLNEKNEVETESGFKKVKVGIKSLSDVQILEGLKAGDVIYKPKD